MKTIIEFIEYPVIVIAARANGARTSVRRKVGRRKSREIFQPGSALRVGNRPFVSSRLHFAVLMSRCTVSGPLLLLLSSLLLCSPMARAQNSSGADALPALVTFLKESSDAQLQLDILRGLSAAFKGQRQVPMPKGWEGVEIKLGQSPNADVRALAQSLALTFGSTQALAALRKTASDPSADLNARRTALNSLLDTKDAGLPPLLQQLLRDTSLRGAAVRGLAAYDDPKTPEAILSVYAALDGSEKRDALNTLSARAAFAKPMLAAVAQGTIPRNALTAEIVRQLRSLKNADIDAALQKVYGVIRESSADQQKEIERYKRIYRAGGSQPGDAQRGRAVFVRVCQQCHTLFDTGGKVGPDLTGSNRADLDYILQNIIDPNAVIPNDYRASTVETKDGRNITGIVKQQDDKSVTIVTQNETLTLPRNEIQSLQESALSMMPEGLFAPLTDQEMRDLLYYLSRTGQVPLPGETK
jgi:putative heme-binding domain-containing protein